MDHPQNTNLELLKRLIGNRAAKRLYRGKLAPLFAPEGAPNRTHHERAAARELVERWLAEELASAVSLSAPTLVTEYLQVLFAGQQFESFVAIFLNVQNRLIATEEMFRGTLTQTAVYPREIVKRALELNAAGAIFAHNDPSGIPEPSTADIQLTEHLKKALALVDVRVVDPLCDCGKYLGKLCGAWVIVTGVDPGLVRSAARLRLNDNRMVIFTVASFDTKAADYLRSFSV